MGIDIEHEPAPTRHRTAEHDAPAHHHGGGIKGALKEIPTWGWWAMGGAVLILILWRMHSGGASAAPAGLDAGTTQLPPTASAPGDAGSGAAQDNTQAILDGLAGLQQNENDALQSMMQAQSDALGQMFDLSSQQQAAAFQGLADTESSLGDTMSAVLSAIDGLSQNPVVNNPGTSGDGNPGNDIPVGMPPADFPAPTPPSYFPPPPPPPPAYDPYGGYVAPVYNPQPITPGPDPRTAMTGIPSISTAPAPSPHDPVVIHTETPSKWPRGVPQTGSGGDVGYH
jgi:hypothetical protein